MKWAGFPAEERYQGSTKIISGAAIALKRNEEVTRPIGVQHIASGLVRQRKRELGCTKEGVEDG